ncbi:MAG: acetate--CoA ligase family protein [Candidatus Bathyarchaeia archaeon]
MAYSTSERLARRARRTGIHRTKNAEQTSSLDYLFKPESIAVIGSSDDPQKFSGCIIPGMLQVGYGGRIYPVNPKRTMISGLKCYESISSLPEAPQLAMIVIPSGAVKQVLSQCIKAGVRASIVFTAEIRYESDSKQEQAAILAEAGNNGMRICGPNCEGVIYLKTGTWATFLSHSSPLRGEIAFITQSGGVGEFVLHKSWERQLGISGWVSSGNEMDLQVADYIEYFARDRETKAISVFLETARDGQKFIRAARLAFNEQKPLVVLKVGKSERAKAAALTHTGAIAGKYGVYMGLFRQLGIVSARNLQELVELPMALAWEPLPAGKRVGVLADSGGIAVLLADQIAQEGLAIQDFEDETKARLMEILGPNAKVVNPLDITALAGPREIVGILESVGESMLDDKTCDMLVFVVSYWPQHIYYEALEALGRLFKTARSISKPILPVFTAITPKTHSDLLARAAELKLPIYLSPEPAVASARALFDYSEARREGLGNL